MLESQIGRVISLYERLYNGEKIVKKEEAEAFQVSEKTIQRDIAHIRDYLTLHTHHETIQYDKKTNAYVWPERYTLLKPEVIYLTSKVLLESRAFLKEELTQIINHLLNHCNLAEKEMLEELLEDDRRGYKNLQTATSITDTLLTLANAAKKRMCIEVVYKKEGDKAVKPRTLLPLGIVFSEYYFYLIAYQTSFTPSFPTVYRVDRIQSIQPVPHFQLPYELSDMPAFNESTFRDRIQFMYTGELLSIRFRFKGPSRQAVLDRLPTAYIEVPGSDIFTANVYGKGVKMWLLSQGRHIEVLSPPSFREEMKQELQAMVALYE